MTNGQPALTAEEQRSVQEIIEQHRARPGPLLEILHAVQKRLGCVPGAAVPVIAMALNLSRAEVQGVLSFYPHLRHAPPGRHLLQVCRAEACQAMAGRGLEQHLQERLGIGFHQTTPDGQFSLEPVYCLGNCACAPAWMLDGELHGRLTIARAEQLLAGAGLKAGPET